MTSRGIASRVAAPFTLARLAGQGAEMLGWIILGRRLGGQAFGDLAVAALACRYGGLIGDWGATYRGPRDVAHGADAVDQRRLIDLRTKLSLGLAFLYVAIVVAIRRPDLAVVALAIPARGMTRDWIALGQGRAFAAAVPSTVNGVIFAGLAMTTTSAAGGAIAIGLAAAIALAVSASLSPVPNGGAASTSRLTVLSGWALLIALADQVFVSSDTFLLAALTDRTTAGIYNLVYRIPNAWVTIVGLAALGSLPAVTTTLRDRPHAYDDLRRRALKVGRLGALALVVVSPVLILSVGPLLGPEYVRGRAALTILLVSTAVKTSTAALQPIYLAVLPLRRLAVCLIGAAALNIAANLVLIPHWGMVGAASATLGAELVLSWHLLARTRRPTSTPSLPRLPTTARPTVDVVILTWNDGPLLDHAIASALGSVGVDVHVTVVDNGSVPAVEIAGERLSLLSNSTNRGVAAARNQGTTAGDAPFVCLLDSDARLEPECLRTLVDAITSGADIALAAPVFVGQSPSQSGGAAPTLSRKVGRVLGVTSSYEDPRPDDQVASWDVDFVIGACQVFRRDAFNLVHGIDERYHYGPEDVDFCLRLRRAGLRVLQVEGARCHHPPRRRNRAIMTARGARHAVAVARHLWRHRGYQPGDGRVVLPRHGVDGPTPAPDALVNH